MGGKDRKKEIEKGMKRDRERKVAGKFPDKKC